MMTITHSGTDIWRVITELAIIGYLIYLSVYDIRYHKIRNNAVLLFLPIVMMKCTLRVCMGTLNVPGTLFAYVHMLLGAVAGFVILLSAAMITHGGIGGGDIKLTAVLGLAAGLTGTLVSLVVASLAAAGYGAFQMYVRKKPKVSLAFVPFLLAGYVTALLIGFC
jgi:prepilin signal peptidase PulO-like enzyme (type II secretory pathway)